MSPSIAIIAGGREESLLARFALMRRRPGGATPGSFTLTDAHGCGLSLGMAGRYTGSYLGRPNGWRAVAILADTGQASLVDASPRRQLWLSQCDDNQAPCCSMNRIAHSDLFDHGAW